MVSGSYKISRAFTYFSLSTRDGHRDGNTFVAQSSSLNRSEVAARACRAALRACTKGSRSPRAKAAVRTFCLVYMDVSIPTSLGRYHLTHVGSQVPSDLP